MCCSVVSVDYWAPSTTKRTDHEENDTEPRPAPRIWNHHHHHYYRHRQHGTHNATQYSEMDDTNSQSSSSANVLPTDWLATVTTIQCPMKSSNTLTRAWYTLGVQCSAICQTWLDASHRQLQWHGYTVTWKCASAPPPPFPAADHSTPCELLICWLTTATYHQSCLRVI